MLDMTAMLISHRRWTKRCEKQPADYGNQEHHRPRELLDHAKLAACNPQTSDQAQTETLTHDEQNNSKLPVHEKVVD